MKITTTLSLLTAFFLISSCVNPQKLLEKGEYERAFKISLSQLSSNKGKPSTESIQILDAALDKIWKKDSTNIARLSQSSTEKDWDKALDLRACLNFYFLKTNIL